MASPAAGSRHRAQQPGWTGNFKPPRSKDPMDPPMVEGEGIENRGNLYVMKTGNVEILFIPSLVQVVPRYLVVVLYIYNYLQQIYKFHQSFRKDLIAMQLVLCNQTSSKCHQ